MALWTLATPALSLSSDSNPRGLSLGEELTGTWCARSWAWLPCARSCLGHQEMRWPVVLTRPPTAPTVPGPARVLCSYACVHAKTLQSYTTLCDPMDCSLPGPSVCRFLQARILKWVAIPSSRSSWPKINPESLASSALADNSLPSHLESVYLNMNV